jgi:energy-converting hydrogenase B subunit D
MLFTALDYWNMVLMLILVATALAMYFIKDLLHAVIVFGAYSLIMALIWLQMNSPDLAITEAAAGIGMTVLMMAVIFHISRKEE